MPLFLNNSNPKCAKVYFLRPLYLNFFRLNREVPVLLYNFFLGFYFVSLTLVKIICVWYAFPWPNSLLAGGCLSGVFLLSHLETNSETWSCLIEWETLPLILLDRGCSLVLLLLFSCPEAVGSFLSLSIFLLIEFTCCLPFSRLTELLSKIVWCQFLCCHTTNFLCPIAICLFLMYLQYFSRFLCCDGFDDQIKLYKLNGKRHMR